MPELQQQLRNVRSAFLAHGLGLLSLAAGTCAFFFIPDSHEERDAVVGMAVSAAIVFLLWSLVLAVRSLLQKERSRWAWVIFYLTLVEFSAPALWLWTQTYNAPAPVIDFFMWLGVPVFVPYFSLGSAIATPIAVWRSRKTEQLTKRTLARWYVAIMIVLAIFLIPGPLFLFGATTVRFYDFRTEAITVKAWPAKVAANTPDFVRNIVETLIYKCGGTRIQDAWLSPMYATANVSADRMVARIHEDSVYYRALWYGLSTYHPEHALRISEEVLSNKLSVGSRLMQMMFAFIAEHGNGDQLKALLDKGSNSLMRQAITLALKRIENENRTLEFMPQLQKLALEREKWNESETALRLIARALSPKLIIEQLSSNNSVSRHATLRALIRFEFGIPQPLAAENNDQVEIIRQLNRFLSADEIWVCRDAVRVLGKIFPQNSSPTVPESEQIETLKKSVRDWFDAHKLLP